MVIKKSGRMACLPDRMSGVWSLVKRYPRASILSFEFFSSYSEKQSSGWFLEILHTWLRMFAQNSTCTAAFVQQLADFYLVWKMRLFVVQCGLSGNTTAAVSDRIVGGTNAAENEFPWQVSVRRSQGSFRSDRSVT